MPAVLGDFLAAADEHLEAAMVVGDGQVPHLHTVARELHRLIAVMSRCADDLAPFDKAEAVGRNDLQAWERAVIDTSEALHAAEVCLRRTSDETGDPTDATVTWRARKLAAATAQLTAGRDLLHTHLASRPDGLTQDRSEWAPVVTSLPATRALTNEITRWSRQLAPFTAWLAGSATSYALRHTPGHAVTVTVRDNLADASQWLQAAGSSALPALDADPVRPSDTELLCAIPLAAVPHRHRPSSTGESVAKLCYGITVSASRLRAAFRDSKEPAKWSPNVTSGAWQWMAQAAAVTSHLSELALRSLATRASQLPDVPVTEAQLTNAADRMIGMRAAWQKVDQMWDDIVTETRLLQTPAMAEASDLVLRMGRLVWDNPQWTPVRSDRSRRRTPVTLARGATGISAVVTAAHQAVDALARMAMTDIEAISAAEHAGRLYVPTRSLSDDYDVPRPFAPAPAAPCRALQDAYRGALDASTEAAQALDGLALAARTPSVMLALARAAIPVQSRRRGSLSQSDDDFRDPMPADTRFMHSRASTGQAGLLEKAITDRGCHDPIILFRAAAIDDAARQLIKHAETETPESGSPDALETTQHTTSRAADLAAQGFPCSPLTGPSAGTSQTQPANPPIPRAVPRSSFQSHNSRRHS
jgi:hypothetical protein